MIIFPASLIGTAEPSLDFCRIGWHNLLRGLLPSAITASSETAEGPKDMPLQPDTATYWEADAMPASWVADLGAPMDLDYIGIAGHTIGSSGAAVEVALSEDSDFDARLTLPGTVLNYAITPDSVANSIVGDIDIRVKVSMDDWTPAAANYFASKYNAGTQNSWLFGITNTGTLSFQWSPDGTVGALINKYSTVVSGAADGQTLWIRATLDVNNGAGGNDVKFYTSADGVTWTQLGATVTTAGVTSIFNSTTGVELGGFAAGSGITAARRVYYADIRNGLAAPTPAVKFDPANGATGGTSFVSDTGETWTINTSGATPARLVNPIFASGLMPADDAPILFLDSPRVARYVRVRLTGAVAPKIAVIYAGEILAMPRDMTAGGFTPVNLSRQTELHQSLSRGGQFLGQGFRRMGVKGSISFKYLDPEWVREVFEPFVLAARNQPYFIAWWPAQYPLECAYVWTDKDIVPSYMGFNDAANQSLMDVSFPMQGIGWQE